MIIEKSKIINILQYVQNRMTQEDIIHLYQQVQQMIVHGPNPVQKTGLQGKTGFYILKGIL